jgi:hypothetical protein
MLAIAEQTTAVGVAAGSLHLKGVGVPTKAAPKQTTDVRETVGAVGGVLTLIAVPALGFLALRRRRELGAVRTQLESGLERGARLPLAPVPFEPGSAAARAAERARLARQPGSRARPAREERHRSGGRKRTLYLGLALFVIAAGAVAFVLATSGGGSAKHSSRPAQAQTPALPTVPVAVLNAGTQQGAAKTLADQLRGEHVNIGSVGNLVEARPPGMQILYAPGQSAQASRLAHLLSSHQPVVAAIDPATSAAVGSGAQLVVVVG